MWRWLLLAAWAGLPLSLGQVVSSALAPWSALPAAVAEAMLWAAWAGGLVATLVPRPWGFAVVRSLAVLGVALGVLTVGSSDGVIGAVAVGHGVAVLGLVSLTPTGAMFANTAAYGNERRYPLQSSPGLGLVVAPVAALLVGAGVASGPILVADGRLAAGVAALAVGLPLAYRLWHSLDALGQRWVVLVPGGIVVHDPVLLTNAVLIPRAEIGRVGLAAGPFEPGADLRLGARARAIEITATEPIPLSRVARRGRDVEIVSGPRVVVSVARPGAFLSDAKARGFPVT